MTLASRLRLTAAKKVATYGEPVTWRSIARVYSVATAATVETVTEYAYTVAVQPEERTYVEPDVVRAESLVVIGPARQSTDVALAFTPKLDDRVVMNGREFQVVGLEEIRVQGVVVAYTFSLRR
jgi:hypothetical protein